MYTCKHVNSDQRHVHVAPPCALRGVLRLRNVARQAAGWHMYLGATLQHAWQLRLNGGSMCWSFWLPRALALVVLLDSMYTT